MTIDESSRAIELDRLEPDAATMEDDRLIEASASVRASRTTKHERILHARTLLKLDLILLPFLSLLFLFNSLDKSNIGSAETGNFTKDTGLPAEALNISVACFFATFVTLQPVGAALGRKFGMKIWVPSCMALWGLCTALHITIKKEWQLIALRTIVGALEAGFYPTTVSYLSLFYTRFEFAKRLGMFYSQAAIAGAVGGLLSWIVFRMFPNPPPGGDLPPSQPHSYGLDHGLKSWQILFLIEGLSTMIIALVGFWWLPHSAGTAWFLSPEERQYAEMRIRRDIDTHSKNYGQHKNHGASVAGVEDHLDGEDSQQAPSGDQEDEEEASRLLSSYDPSLTRAQRKASIASVRSVTDDRGLTRADILSALLDWKVWYLLGCNILSAIPATAFSVFLPLVVKGLVHDPEESDLTPAKANLLTVPPFVAGACVLWTFTAWSDRSRERLVPIFYGLMILIAGLTATVMLPMKAYIWRYMALIVLLSGSFVPSPLTVAWLTNNIPEPGKRTIVLGINGWGNLAGVIAAAIFAPRFEDNGYIVPFYITLACVLVSFVGFVAFRAMLLNVNHQRDMITAKWSPDQLEREALHGDVGLVGPLTWVDRIAGDRLARNGDMKLTYRYEL